MTKKAVTEGIGWDEEAYILSMSDETAQDMFDMLSEPFTLVEVADAVRSGAE